jgi:hypothetical protein
MDRQLVEFANLLRENGIPCSPAEDLDAFSAVRLVGIDQREAFRCALRATLVKRERDVPLFEQLFDEYFGGLGAVMGTVASPQARGLERLLEELLRVSDVSPWTLAWLRDDRPEIEKRVAAALREVAKGTDLYDGRDRRVFSQALAEALGVPGVMRELALLEERSRSLALEPEAADRLRDYLREKREELRALIEALAGRERRKHELDRETQERWASLSEKSFYYLTEEEIRQMRVAVSRLAERLKNIVAIRRKRANHGRFDVKGTFRKNLQFGGVPFRIELERPRKERPQIVILCDVSDSVRNVSRFMLQFVYSLQELCSRVRSFVFVAETGEVTRLFQESEIHEAIETALRGGVINVFAHSDFGRAFRMFHRNYLTAVDHRTTVIILGDARNNYNAPHEWVLGEIRRRGKQLIWLNPENRATWGFGDSEMERYRPFCDVVEECRNLRQLYRVIDRLVFA